jgi:cold shock CspA family protein
MASGKLVWFNEGKGYGFVEDENGEQFLLRSESINSAARKKIKPGKTVKFSVEEENIDLSNKQVRLIKSFEIV